MISEHIFLFFLLTVRTQRVEDAGNANGGLKDYKDYRYR
jgi:hypothetical protein